MDSFHLVDPALRPLLDLFPTVDITADNLEARRNRELPVAPGDESLAALSSRAIAGATGAPELMVHMFRPAVPAQQRLPCILHIHGGGYVAGSALDLDARLRRLAAETEALVLSVDYRLAPETPFPGPLDDCYAALGWAFSNAEALGIDPARIGLKGESAGGGLAAGLALLARDRADYSLAFLHLTYPMIDDRTGASIEPHATVGEFIWNRHNNRFAWQTYLGAPPGSEDVSPYAAAARATDLAGLPPTFIATGGLDLFVEENIAFAHRLVGAGVPTECHLYPGAFHGFDLWDAAPVAQAAWRDGVAALRRFLA